MKTVSKALCILMAVLAIGVHTHPAMAAQPETTEKCNEKQKVIAITNGMVCDFCVQSLKKMFLKNPSIETVDINLTTKEVILTPKTGQNIDDQSIRKAVEWGGYELVDIKREKTTVCTP